MNKENSAHPSPWLLLEICAFFLSAEDFQHYCDTHPEEVQSAKNLLEQESS